MSGLPSQLPPEWLTQITAAVKGGKRQLIITTILGSSVISAVVTSGLDYYVQEPRRLQLASQQRLKDDRIDAHKKLAEQLNGFNLALSNSVLTCKIALQRPHEKELASYARQTLSPLADRMISLQLANNQQIDPQISQEAKSILDRVGSALPEAQKSPTNFKALIDLYDTSIKAGLQGLLSKVEQKRAEIAGS